MPDSITDLDPQNSPTASVSLTPEQQLVKDWQPHVGLEDVAAMEYLLDDALTHLGNVLKLLPEHPKQATNARDFLTQFRQPV